jgi:hypothetical protein
MGVLDLEGPLYIFPHPMYTLTRRCTTRLKKQTSGATNEGLKEAGFLATPLTASTRTFAHRKITPSTYIYWRNNLFRAEHKLLRDSEIKKERKNSSPTEGRTRSLHISFQECM